MTGKRQVQYGITALAFFFNTLLGIAVMIKGWGVQPESYGWIWGGAFTTALVVMFTTDSIKKLCGVKDDE
jgi:hypothetical protein